jgi:sec-independent protein translocase protein TatA
MSIGFWQIAIVVVLVVLLFGRGKISSLMGDVAKGIKSFKKGMSDNPDQSTSTTSSKEHIKQRSKFLRINSIQCHKSDGLKY